MVDTSMERVGVLFGPLPRGSRLRRRQRRGNRVTLEGSRSIDLVLLPSTATIVLPTIPQIYRTDQATNPLI